MTTNPYASLCRKYPHMCKFLGTIPSNQLQYAKVPFWNNLQIPTFQSLLGIADHCHMEHQGQGLPQCSQQRLAKRTCQRKPEATWEIQNIHNHPYQTALGSGQHSGLNKSNKLPIDHPQASEGPDKTSALIG